MTRKIQPPLLRYRPWLIGIFQAWLVFCSLFLSWLLRFDFTLPYRSTLFLAAPILVAARLASMAYFGLFRGWWKYAGVKDGIEILKSVGAGSILFWLVMHIAFRGVGFPRSIYVLEAVLAATSLVGVRLLSRAIAVTARENLSNCIRVVVIGAGAAAQTILRELHHPKSGYMVVACLDDDPSKVGIRINSVPVLGRVDQLPDILSSHPAEEALIAVPSATGSQMRRFVEICTQAGVKFRTVPALRDIIAGTVTVRQLREVRLEDLLGREPVRINLESVRREIAGRTVLVTGAAGSIGSELCRQILDYDCLHVICVDQNETGLFFLCRDLKSHKNGARITFAVADVNDDDRMRIVLKDSKPEIIFHAAAYKHVPIMESNVQEAVKNNVLALLGLLSLAEESQCKSFVLISSDKAVNPTSIMGATKRICELILASRPSNGMRCVSVRFGNVLGSSGSVVPVLGQQLRNHEPLTITHPEIKRFFMMTHEAVALVLQAFTIGNHGDILVLEMGEPVRILDLARSLIRLSGKSEHEVEIRFTGLREGEKLHEELFYHYEQTSATSCDKIKRTRGSRRNWVELCQQLDQLRASMSIDGAAPVRMKVKEIVPEYSYSGIPPTPGDSKEITEGYLRKGAAATD
jgi:FlaA1/EpsC-like NDP-sugar epimerase